MKRFLTKSKRGKSRGFTPRRELSDGSAYAGQQKVTLRLESGALLLSTTITTGVISSAYPVEASEIVGFATRFGSTFDEYRILGADVRVTPVSASTGVSKMWFDEKSPSAPTSNESQERTVVPLANTNAMASSRKTFRWRARDLLDLQYTAIGTTSVNPVSFKVYTDNALYGAPVAVTNLWLIEPVMIIEFRGLKST
jgi:hypothetical protein